MKGLSIRDKNYDSYETMPNSKEEISHICPDAKRSLISKQNKKREKKINNINIISHLNNFDNSKISNESPKKLLNSLQSYYFDMNNKNKKNNIIKKKKPFDSGNKPININEKKSYYFMNLFEIPEIKDFNSYYEIKLHGKYDFIFLLRGGLSKKEWIEKTKIIRKYPRHLKNTLFYQSNIKLKNIHKQNFSKIYKIFAMIKKKGDYLYINRNFKECLGIYNYSYGLFKWIEFKDKNLKIDSINNEMFSILDDDIEEKRVIMDNNNKNEKYLFKVSLVYILEIMAYCYMELRLYSRAIECLDECESIAGDNLPDIYLRRAQARIYNKKISDQELKIAEKDINKAINLVLSHNSDVIKKFNNFKSINLINTDLYYKTKNKYNQIVLKRQEIKVNNIRKLLETKLDYKKGLLFDDKNTNITYVISKDSERQYRILKEMKKKYNLAVKFFTETKNEEQLDLTYKEYEIFYEIFSQFKYFYKFSIKSLDKTVIEKLNENEIRNLINEKLIERNKLLICESIFLSGNYNVELYKYVVDKIFEEEKNKKEVNKSKLNPLQNMLKLSNTKYFIFKMSISFIILFFVSVGFQIYYLKHFRGYGITKIDK